MVIVNPDYDKYGLKRPLKKSKNGMEVEMHLLDKEGNIAFNALDIIKKVKKINKNLPIVKECGKNMIEFGCYPTVNTLSPAMDLINSIETTKDIMDKNETKFFPFATYPGKFEANFTDSPMYNIKRKIFGKERFDLATKAVGFHHHYTLPKGVFDANTKTLRLFRQSKLKRSLINSYNFEIAIDPLLTLFTQSSPFYEGNYMAKDSRMVIYRGGKKFNNPNGLYAKYRSLGHLPNYVQTQTDLMGMMRNNHLKWKRLINQADKTADFDNIYPNKLDIGWGPVKINKHGTLEQRGMDMNLLSTLFSVSTMIKYSLRKIQREFIEVIPVDDGIEESFKIEKGVMYIPPFETVGKSLQKGVVFNGYENDNALKYAKRFLQFSKSIIPKKYLPLLKPVSEMIDNKESMSDKLFKWADKKGLVNEGAIYKEGAKELALYSNQLFENDLVKIKKKLQYISSL